MYVSAYFTGERVGEGVGGRWEGEGGGEKWDTDGLSVPVLFEYLAPFIICFEFF